MMETTVPKWSVFVVVLMLMKSNPSQLIKEYTIHSTLYEIKVRNWNSNPIATLKKGAN